MVPRGIMKQMGTPKVYQKQSKSQMYLADIHFFKVSNGKTRTLC